MTDTHDNELDGIFATMTLYGMYPGAEQKAVEEAKTALTHWRDKAVVEAKTQTLAKINAWACTVPGKHALGENGQQAVYDYVDNQLTQENSNANSNS